MRWSPGTDPVPATTRADVTPPASTQRPVAVQRMEPAPGPAGPHPPGSPKARRPGTTP